MWKTWCSACSNRKLMSRWFLWIPKFGILLVQPERNVGTKVMIEMIAAGESSDTLDLRGNPD